MTTELATETTPTAAPADQPTWWGKRMLIDLGGCDPAVIRDPAKMNVIIRRLVQKIGMQAYGRPQMQHFGEGDKAGWTIQQLITTSNIDFHANDETGSVFINLFSCNNFDENLALVFLVSSFGAAHHRSQVIHHHIPGGGDDSDS